MDQIEEEIAPYLEKIVTAERHVHHEGSLPEYVEKVSNSDHDAVGVCMMGTRGLASSAGDVEELFSLQSVSKVISLVLALMDNGPEEVFRYVDKEPSGDPYHSIATLEERTVAKPYNPMNNAGAIAVSALIKGANADERFGRLLDLTRRLAGNPGIDINPALIDAKSSDLVRALFYYMRKDGIVRGTEEERLSVYIKQTAIEMNCQDLARIGAVLANKGRDPHTGAQLVDESIVSIVLTLMFTCGMYNGSGTFAVDVGFPAKSGFSGAILAAVPGRMGFGVIGPSLDAQGNSIAGVRILRQISQRWRLGVFS